MAFFESKIHSISRYRVEKARGNLKFKDLKTSICAYLYILEKGEN